MELLSNENQESLYRFEFPQSTTAIDKRTDKQTTTIYVNPTIYRTEIPSIPLTITIRQSSLLTEPRIDKDDQFDLSSENETKVRLNRSVTSEEISFGHQQLSAVTETRAQHIDQSGIKTDRFDHIHHHHKPEFNDPNENVVSIQILNGLWNSNTNEVSNCNKQQVNGKPFMVQQSEQIHPNQTTTSSSVLVESLQNRINDSNVINRRECSNILLSDNEIDMLRIKNQLSTIHSIDHDSERMSKSNFLYYMLSSGQTSPSDTLDSGTCSDLETTPPIYAPSKKSSTILLIGSDDTELKSTKLLKQLTTPNILNGHSYYQSNGYNRTSISESSSLSNDSLNLSDLIVTPQPTVKNDKRRIKSKSPDVDNRYRSLPTIETGKLGRLTENSNERSKTLTKICGKNTSTNQNGLTEICTVNGSSEPSPTKSEQYEDDRFFNKFHVNEWNDPDMNDSLTDLRSISKTIVDDDESFAGIKDKNCSPATTIRSAKGTVRGVKNRVRNGIATFLQIQQPNVKNFKERDAGKVVLYTTSMGIVRETYAKCANVKKILRAMLIKFEERDVFMSCDYQLEIKERMQTQDVHVPHLYVDGNYIGSTDEIERLNETGELRQLLKPYKSIGVLYTCQVCGGYRLLPCPSCNGSKKSIHRNNFTTDFVALKCMNCDEVGLVKCYNC